MSEFFESEIVQNELKEISELQEKVYSKVFTYPSLSKEEQINHINELELLLEKQKILYMRMSLSDNPEAKDMMLHIQDSAVMMGMPENIDMNLIFSNMSKIIQLMKKHIEIED